MPKHWWRLDMGSQVSSNGHKSEASDTQTAGERISAHKTTTKYDQEPQHNEATNTNAREHGQPDRLKLLFRDQRGYRTLSEQKVTEWLTKNKQYYRVIPRDLTEIPEQIFVPLEPPDADWHHDDSHSNQPKSDVSGQNLESRGLGHGASEVYHSRRNRDKMNHFFQKPNVSKQTGHHSSMIIHKSDLSHSRGLRSLVRHSRDGRKGLDQEGHRIERSTTTAESLSTRLVHRELERLSGMQRRHRVNCSRRDSHSLVPNSSHVNRRQSDGWPMHTSCLGARKTLPGMLQNNAYIRQRLRPSETFVEPVRSLQQTLSSKRTQNSRKQTVAAVPRREKAQRHFEMLPMGKDCQLQEARNQLMKFSKSRSQSAIWRSPYSIKKFQRFATMWMSGSGKSPEPCEVSERLL